MEKGRSHQYYPLVSKESYQQDFLENAVEKVFSGSVQSLLSALIEQENMTDAELEELKKLLDR